MSSDSKVSSELKVIGIVVDAHGIKGELKIKLFSSDTEWHQDFDLAYISDRSYKVEKLRLNKSFWILKLEELNDRNQAEELKGKDLFAQKNLFVTQDGENPYLSELLGFEVFLEGKPIGSVYSFQETSAHFSIVLKTKIGFFEIPYVDAFIKSLDRKNGKLDMSFPEDLLSIEYKLEDLK